MRILEIFELCKGGYMIFDNKTNAPLVDRSFTVSELAEFCIGPSLPKKVGVSEEIYKQIKEAK